MGQAALRRTGSDSGDSGDSGDRGDSDDNSDRRQGCRGQEGAIKQASGERMYEYSKLLSGVRN